MWFTSVSHPQRQLPLKDQRRPVRTRDLTSNSSSLEGTNYTYFNYMTQESSVSVFIVKISHPVGIRYFAGQLPFLDVLLVSL